MARPSGTYRSGFRRFIRSRLTRVALGFLVLLGILALFADVIANDKPLYCTIEGKARFPAFTPQRSDSITDPKTGELKAFRYDVINWHALDLPSAIWAPVPYASKVFDEYQEPLLSPLKPQHVRDASGRKRPLSLRFRHWLGTSERGTDLLAGIIHGTRISLGVGIMAVAVAGLIGILMGLVAGYFGDRGIHIRLSMVLMLIPGLFFAGFYSFHYRRFVYLDAASEGFWSLLGAMTVSLLLFAGILLLFVLVAKGLERLGIGRRQIALPLDSIVLRIMETLNSLPQILLILTIAAITSRSIWIIMLIIGLSSWTGIARLMRAEMLRIRKMEYIDAARVLGLPPLRILFRHALPNGMAPVLVAMAFGVGNAIIAESALSFLGLAESTVTWGSLLSAARSAESYRWWIAVFPGMMIFFTVISFNLLGEGLRDWLDPRST